MSAAYRLLVLSMAMSTALGTPVRKTTHSIDLTELGDSGFRILGSVQNDAMGNRVSGIGDVNGDGFGDVIIGGRAANPYQDLSAGKLYVVFGSPDSTDLDLSSVGVRGFRIDSVEAVFSGVFDPGFFFAHSAAGVGDFNGDGLDDFVIGADGAGPTSSTGVSFLVFGKTDGNPLDLGALGHQGIRFDSPEPAISLGHDLSGAGDVNGDGYSDILIGAPGAAQSGIAYLVFGRPQPLPVDLARLNDGGFRIDRDQGFEGAGTTVAGAGDINGDGLDDILIGSFRADAGGNEEAGATVLIYGKADTESVNLNNLGDQGFVIQGAASGDLSGWSLGAAGDVNGDGLADMVIGAVNADPGGNAEAGESYVVFGKTDRTDVHLGVLNDAGFAISGAGETDLSGFSVGGAGDINGDGLADLTLGAILADPLGQSNAGEAYIVFGKRDSVPVTLSELGMQGVSIAGVSPSDGLGRSVSGAGDVNGDGRADVILGAGDVDRNELLSVGASYVVFGQSPHPMSASYRTAIRNGDAPRRAIGVIGDGRNASHPDSRTWVDFADGKDPNGDASPLTVTLNRTSSIFFNDAVADVAWELSTDRINWTAAGVRFRYLDSELSIANEDRLQVFHSADGGKPFVGLRSKVRRDNNTISADTDRLGFFYLGEDTDLLFIDAFE